MSDVSSLDRLRYRFDAFLSRGTGALLAGLFVASAVLVLAIAAVVVISGQAPEEEGTRLGFLSLAWMGLLRTLDTGTMGGDTGSPFFLAAMLAVTLGGVFTVSTLIGVLNNGLDQKLSELRRGRSRVIEDGHTLILGWSDQLFTIIPELVQAQASERTSCIVVLGDRDKVEMEDEIRARVGETGRTRIVCRRGSPIDPGDLDMVSVRTTKSVIVTSPDEPDPDNSVIKTLLAIVNSPTRRPSPYHVVAEIQDARNMEAARLVGRDEVQLVLVGELVSRIIAQTCRQSGLSVVYTELLDFGGDEMYFTSAPALTGRTFGEALFAYPTSSVLGLRKADGGVVLNPPMDTRLADGDALVVVAEDDSAIRCEPGRVPQIDDAAIRTGEAPSPKPERTLVLGWNARGPSIVNELDHYVASGSSVTIVADVDDLETQVADGCRLQHQSVSCQRGDTTDRRTLDAIEVGRYQHIILLCYSDQLDVQKADARTLITLLHLRDIATRTGTAIPIVSEMLDLRNRALASVTRADDFIVSDRLVSLLLAQISENRDLHAVFTDLFDPDGSEVYVKPASHYVTPGARVTIDTLVEAARRRGEVALGYRHMAAAGDADRGYGVVINPDKSSHVTLEADDRVIVVAES